MPDLPLELRRAADGVIISANHFAGLLGPDRVPHDADPRVAIVRYGAESRELQVWFAWSASRRFHVAWLTHLAETMPAHGTTPKTMGQ